MSPEITVTIENWKLIYSNSLKEGTLDFSLLSVDPNQFQLQGQVYGHPEFDDGTVINTNLLDGKIGELIFSCSGTAYLLGTPSMTQEHQLKNSNIELIDFLPEITKPRQTHNNFKLPTQDL